ncbi:hypothetical protein ES708_04733 [subsurface metagenome]
MIKPLGYLKIRQDVLAKWIGDPPKIDVTDALLIAFIRSLNPENKKVAELMWRGYFMLSRKFVKGSLPLINLTDDWISRKIKNLQKIGLVDLCLRDTGKGKLRYVKLSKLYWQEERRVEREEVKNQEEYSPTGVQSDGSTDPNPTGSSPRDHTYDHKEETADPQTAGIPGGPQPGIGSEPKAAESLPEFPDDSEEETVPRPEAAKHMSKVSEMLNQKKLAESGVKAS